MNKKSVLPTVFILLFLPSASHSAATGNSVQPARKNKISFSAVIPWER